MLRQVFQAGHYSGHHSAWIGCSPSWSCSFYLPHDHAQNPPECLQSFGFYEVLSPDEALRPDACCPCSQCGTTDDLLNKSYTILQKVAIQMAEFRCSNHFHTQGCVKSSTLASRLHPHTGEKMVAVGHVQSQTGVSGCTGVTDASEQLLHITESNAKHWTPWYKARWHWLLEQWRCLAWSDKGCFSVWQSDGEVGVCWLQGEQFLFGGGGVMVWGSFSRVGLSPSLPAKRTINLLAQLIYA